MNLLLRRRGMMRAASAPTPILPSGYQRVEWISRNSSAYDGIATGFVPTPNSSIIARFAAEGTQSNYNFIGLRDGSSGANNALLIVSFRSAQKIGFFRWGASVQCISYDNQFHDYELTPTAAKIDGVSYNLSAPDTSQSATHDIRLFLQWTGSNWSTSANMQIASCSLWDNGIKKHDLVPCYRKADNAKGFYDLINNSFLTGYNSNNYTVGNDIN